MLKTRLTELLGIEYPIQCGTMQGLTRAEVVAAVGNAGGFSCIPAAMFTKKEDLLDEIKKAFDLTDKPFGVNVGLFPEMVVTVSAEERISWVIEAGVKILETAGRSPQPYRQMIADGGLIHIHKCARVRDAKKVEGLGVDIISIVGTECGGHPSMEDVTSYELGQELSVEMFEAGDGVNVSGVTKGRGFQGVIKRHGFSGGDATHGNTAHRVPSSVARSAR